MKDFFCSVGPIFFHFLNAGEEEQLQQLRLFFLSLNDITCVIHVQLIKR